MATEGEINHPYIPRDLKLPGFVPGFLSSSTRLAYFGIPSLMVVSFTWILSGGIHKISKVDRILMCWWILTGLAHIIFEGYFVFSPEFYKVNTPHFLAEVCKNEKLASKGDSRFVARESGVVSVEITMVVLGPACLLAVYAIATKKTYSYILQLALSLGQLYGTAVFFITSTLEGNNIAASAYYFYVYYVFANAWWILIPTMIFIRCWKKICSACQAQEQNKTRRSKTG
ncbi:hypothetical protein ACJIZ3_012358 [Penstemon smallii]|uniref:EXPERA domain-containing protein n=1 Tax=Penstemon smallii TaxID=265156 RepID=A0ABD3ULR8_9LAMI